MSDKKPYVILNRSEQNIIYLICDEPNLPGPMPLKLRLLAMLRPEWFARRTTEIAYRVILDKINRGEHRPAKGGKRT